VGKSPNHLQPAKTPPSLLLPRSSLLPLLRLLLSLALRTPASPSPPPTPLTDDDVPVLSGLRLVLDGL
jgi:hypothetical protein